ncbi:trifunctional serine/threonine-protein kinase/ATP-binding protein/sensor histidine kinase [Ancylobacter lacus]|uniref:trifunctional serine/threonine-protein kinase/ATP-binding protein/sensor histidine kinase n=1 Tax=Ancylobacter lacus TaxID=2579970 RepID=UPI001BCB83EE|nr:ATP-binding sensor histidine kinase [Ancylobacter lacus]MBS7538181.1 AAA family ATPase [Ancylobacter lacus]
MSNDLRSRLELKNSDWWSGLTILHQTREMGVEHVHVVDAGGEAWWIRAADWNTPQAYRLQWDAALALTLGSDIAEVPTAVGEDEKLSLVYARRSGQVLADLRSSGPGIRSFLDFALAATSTLMRMHDAGVVHGGLSSAKLLVEPDGQVRFTGFAWNSVADEGEPGERSVSEADLAYAAPELIRTDPHPVDARADLYAMGVLLYERLTGTLPFAASDLSGWLHAHVAMEPPSVREIRPDVPAIIDQILFKLIRKDPRQRYQTAAALYADFRRVAGSLAATGHVDAFVLARGDLAEPLHPSLHLVGRHRERAMFSALYEAFRRSPHCRIVLLSGEPGAGKTSLVETFLADMADGSAIRCTGKGVHLRQGTPFAPLAQALRTALAHLMGGDESVLQAARARLDAVVGCRRLLGELVPDLAFLPPEAPVLADVPAHLAQVRSARIIAETFGAIASAGAPLVLFLDDLQWFDHASLNAARQLCSEAPAHVFLVCGYRDDAQNRRSVRDFLDVARASPAFAEDVRIEPLKECDTGELVALLLKSEPEEVAPIAARLHREARGNPFYIGQLLRRSMEEGGLRFDAETQEWRWSEPQGGHPHEIADVMSERIHALPPLQRALLQRCASLGGHCTPLFAARLSGASVEDVVRAANALVAAGLLRRSGAAFAIAHDRVLEAAYATMSPTQRMRDHLSNARDLVTWRPSSEPDIAFDVAAQIEHCDLGQLSVGERPDFARLLLLAARACRSAGEAGRALHFVELIRRILLGAPADGAAALMFDAEWLYGDCLLALGRVDEALAAVDALSDLSRDPVSVADACRLKATALTIKGAYADAIAVAREGLRLLDVDLDPAMADDALEAAYVSCRRELDRVGLDHVLSLPEMTDRRARSALSLLSTLIASFFVKSELRLLHVIRITELTLQHGAAPESAYGLAWLGVLSAHDFGAYERGADYALAACTLARRDGYEAQRTAALIALDQVSAWTVPMRSALGYAREGARVGQAAGDLGMTCYARNHIASDMLVSGVPLDRIHAELVDSIRLTRDIGYSDIEMILTAQLDMVDSLRSGEAKTSVRHSDLVESSVATQFWVKHYTGLQSFLLDAVEAAIGHLAEAEALAWAAPAHIDTANNCFFLALAHAHVPDPQRSSAQRLEQMAVARERFRSWAALNHETFSSKHLILEAEAARLGGECRRAMELYERAAEAAAAARFIQDRALAQELAARLYRDMDLAAPAQGCRAVAVACYREWGAHGKADQLGGHPTPTADADADADAATAPRKKTQHQLDFTVMTAASQALAEEVGLEQVVRTLMKSMVVHAGAQFGLLLLLRGGKPSVEAVARVAAQGFTIAFQPATPPEELMPASVLKTVLRTAKPVTLADAAIEAAQRGLSMGGRSIRSLACLPLIKRGELIGMLYLENALSADVFTPRRMAMLEILAPQAAISLDSARLYGDLMDENLRRARAEFELREARSDLARANQLTAMGSFATSVAHEIKQPLASLVAHADAGLRWLNRAQPDLAEVAKSLQSIGDAGRRAADIVNALRSLVKQSPASLSPVRVDDVLNDVLKIVTPDILSDEIKLNITSFGESRLILANNIQLQQVFFNLITNAIQSMGSTSASERRLNVVTSYRSSDVEVAIEDAGCGMPPDVAARIFQPFFTTKTTGMGVGLAICRSIVELHGGSLDVQSIEGEGSTFFVRLPLAAA